MIIEMIRLLQTKSPDITKKGDRAALRVRRERKKRDIPKGS